MNIEAEISKRRTFAIISHPDAGKTTLTEKLLLFGGAIQTAGAVKSNKIKKTASSDFMEIEKQRGISVSTSVMTFFYEGHIINILDTPGHKDFSEDTYRTLTAVDSVILVIDSVNGVEEQTRKLVKVCRMRDIPIIVFINKMDRPGKDPFDLIDELDEHLSLHSFPMTWPINAGDSFRGVYDIHNDALILFSANKTKIEEDTKSFNSIESEELKQELGEDYEKIHEDVALIKEVYGAFEEEQYHKTKIAPVFFGSALNSFGVRELLNLFIEIAPPIQPKETSKRFVEPLENKLTGFVFKIHANIDPRHRDRIAFFKICSGRFERGKAYYNTRLKKKVKFNNPVSFFGSKKEVTEEAFPGDVVGLYDSGNFKIGDTISEGEEIMYKGIPSFSPEIFKELVNEDPMKSKQLAKAISQLTDEGVAQVFNFGNGNRIIIGTVGELQFDVIQYRVKHEYGASCSFSPMSFSKALWVTTTSNEVLETFKKAKSEYLALDKEKNLVFLAQSEWILNLAKKDYPELTFHDNSEFDK